MDKAQSEINKIDALADRINQYKDHLTQVINHHKKEHNRWVTLINNTGVLDEDAEPILLGPALLAKVELWYGEARKEAYSIAGKNRDMQKFYEAAAEQGQANQYELVKLGKYDSKLNNSTDAQYLSRRVKGRLMDLAAHFEGEFKRWDGVAHAYESSVNAIKDMYKLAEFEYYLERGGKR
jgi:hypothetical protein